jgi:hypothetical protein
MGIGNALIGVGGTLLSKMLGLKSWTLKNTEDGTTLKGQFPAEDVTRNVGGNWSEIQALNRSNAFIQFLNGKTQTLSVQSRFFKRDMFDDSPVDKVEKLIEWTQSTIRFRRPPMLTFILGDGLGLQMDCVCTGVTGIKYGMPNSLGGIREVQFTMEFLRISGRQTAFSSEQEVTDTRYAHAKDGDYYELLCQEEYGDPMIGVIIRQRNPTKPLLAAGDIIALPALEGVRGSVPSQQSIPLKGAYGRKDTIQKQLRLQFFNKRSSNYTTFNYKTAVR